MFILPTRFSILFLSLTFVMGCTATIDILKSGVGLVLHHDNHYEHPCPLDDCNHDVPTAELSVTYSFSEPCWEYSTSVSTSFWSFSYPSVSHAYFSIETSEFPTGIPSLKPSSTVFVPSVHWMVTKAPSIFVDNPLSNTQEPSAAPSSFPTVVSDAPVASFPTLRNDIPNQLDASSTPTSSLSSDATEAPSLPLDKVNGSIPTTNRPSLPPFASTLAFPTVIPTGVVTTTDLPNKSPMWSPMVSQSPTVLVSSRDISSPPSNAPSSVPEVTDTSSHPGIPTESPTLSIELSTQLPTLFMTQEDPTASPSTYPSVERAVSSNGPTTTPTTQLLEQPTAGGLSTNDKFPTPHPSVSVPLDGVPFSAPYESVPTPFPTADITVFTPFTTNSPSQQNLPSVDSVFPSAFPTIGGVSSSQPSLIDSSTVMLPTILPTLSVSQFPFVDLNLIETYPPSQTTSNKITPSESPTPLPFASSVNTWQPSATVTIDQPTVIPSFLVEASLLPSGTPSIMIETSSKTPSQIPSALPKEANIVIINLSLTLVNVPTSLNDPGFTILRSIFLNFLKNFINISIINMTIDVTSNITLLSSLSRKEFVAIQAAGNKLNLSIVLQTNSTVDQLLHSNMTQRLQTESAHFTWSEYTSGTQYSSTVFSNTFRASYPTMFPTLQPTATSSDTSNLQIQTSNSQSVSFFADNKILVGFICGILVLVLGAVSFGLVRSRHLFSSKATVCSEDDADKEKGLSLDDGVLGKNELGGTLFSDIVIVQQSNDTSAHKTTKEWNFILKAEISDHEMNGKLNMVGSDKLNTPDLEAAGSHSEEII